MRNLKDILKESVLDDNVVSESILNDIDSQLETGDTDIIRHVYKVPKLEDFIIRGPRYEVFWDCKELLKKYKNKIKSLPKDSKGLTFIIIKSSNTNKNFIKVYLNEYSGEYMYRTHLAPLNCWRTELDKNILYCKKVILSIIEHLARNPKAFEEFMNYIVEYGRDKDARSSYDDGRPFPVRDFRELLKIKG